MAFVVRFGKPKMVGIQTQFQIDPQRAMGSRLSKGLPKYPQTTGTEQLEVRPGQRGYFPVGVDTRTPGYYQDEGRKSANRSQHRRVTPIR